jgi:hypothetical protein
MIFLFVIFPLVISQKCISLDTIDVLHFYKNKTVTYTNNETYSQIKCLSSNCSFYSIDDVTCLQSSSDDDYYQISWTCKSFSNYNNIIFYRPICQTCKNSNLYAYENTCHIDYDTIFFNNDNSDFISSLAIIIICSIIGCIIISIGCCECHLKSFVINSYRTRPVHTTAIIEPITTVDIEI